MKVHIVLVRSLYSSNIGAAARALANMGGDSLILIDPQTDVNSKARQGAAGAQEWLARRKTYKTWEDFYAHEGEGVRIGLTRRIGKGRKIYPLKTVIRSLDKSENFKNHPHIYLFLGPEDTGLNAEDLSLMNFNCDLPTYGEFPSLNLSQAALLSLYVVKDTLSEHFEINTSLSEDSAVMPTYFPDQSIKKWLTAMGFNLAARRASAYLTLRRLFLQNNPTRHEVQVLEAVLQQNIRKLEESNEPKSI